MSDQLQSRRVRDGDAGGGNKQLKGVFFLAAFAALADPVSHAYYDRKRVRGKRHNAALICSATTSPTNPGRLSSLFVDMAIEQGC